MTIIEFIEDPQLINGKLSPFQKTFLLGVYALPLDSEQWRIFSQATGP